eukprot:6472487-Amphidinium_carterae.1
MVSLRDWAELEHCGFRVAFSKKHVEEEELKQIVDVENSMMASMWRLCFCIMRARVSSMVRHTNGFPQRLAGMLHPTKAHQTLDLLKDMHVAYEEAKDVAHGGVQALVRRSPLSLCHMRLARKLGQSGNWQRVTPQMRQLLVQLFGGIGQTKI